jgi:hypothetical protein
VTTQTVQNKPTAAFLLSLIGGILGFFVGLAVIGLGAFMPLLSGFGLWIIISSLIIIISAAKLNSDPWGHTK